VGGSNIVILWTVINRMQANCLTSSMILGKRIEIDNNDHAESEEHVLGKVDLILIFEIK
jgi:hypothetical protein